MLPSKEDPRAMGIDTCWFMLYEVFYAFPQNGGTSWRGGSGAVFDLRLAYLHGKI